MRRVFGLELCRGTELVVLFERLVANIRAIEVEIGAARGWATLTLVTRVVLGATVRSFARARELEEAELTNLHARPQLDRQVAHIGKLEGHVTREAWVDESGGRVGQEA